MNLKPLGDRVILKQDEAEVTTASGLFLASDAKEKPQTGTIIAVGEGKMDKDGKLLPMPIKVGDKVIYGNLDNGGVSVGTFSKIVTADQQKQYLEYVDQIKDGSFL